MVAKDMIIATVSLTVLLLVTGLGAFIWMAVQGWGDLPGVSVGIIFVSLGVLQTIFSVGWFRVTKKNDTILQNNPDENVKFIEMKDLKEHGREAKA